MSTSRIFVKLGGSILTDKTQAEAINTGALHATIRVIAEVLHENPALRMVIAHGGGSFGHYWAAKYATHRGAHDATGWHGVARVADAMGRLNRLIVAALLEAGVNAIGVQPSASALAHAQTLGHVETATVERMLQPTSADEHAARLVPVLYGDVVLDDVQGAAIVSTEALFAFLAPRLQPQRIVLIGEAGVFTADPRRDPQAARITRITPANIESVLAQTGASHGTDVTGGMAAKVQQMWNLVQRVPGLTVQLVGAEPDALRQALLGESVAAGTLITAAG